ncbi:MAG: hypothetical protein R2819_03695 [Allomuricauda sp.]
MKSASTLMIWVLSCTLLWAQDNYYTVVAEPGDGIFSLLRKQGLDPVKHYEEFIQLNGANLKDGSLLKVGVEYKVPKTSDSFKKTGVVVQPDKGTEEPLFDRELSKMSLKSEKLKDAVYYLILEDQTAEDQGFVKSIAEGLAAELMVHGAQVYVLGNEVPLQTNDSLAMTETQRMGQYVEVINKKYLQNSGKYQRALVIRANGFTGEGNMDVAVYHYNKSEKGQRFAENIQNVFKKNSVYNRSYKDINLIFDDKNSLYLAKNILPAISLLTVENASKKPDGEKIPIRSDKRRFASLLTNGIMNDYVDLEIEN